MNTYINTALVFMALLICKSCTTDEMINPILAQVAPVEDRATALSTVISLEEFSTNRDGSLFLFYKDRINGLSQGLGVRGYLKDEDEQLVNVGQISVGHSLLGMSKDGYYDYVEDGSDQDDIASHRGSEVEINIEGSDLTGRNITTTVEVPPALNIVTNGFAHEVSISKDLELSWDLTINKNVGNTYFAVCGVGLPCKYYDVPASETTLVIPQSVLQSYDFDEENMYIFHGRGIESCVLTDTGYELCIYSLNSGWRSFNLVE